MSAFDFPVGPASPILDSAWLAEGPYLQDSTELIADTFMPGQPSHTEGGSWMAAPEGAWTGPSNIYEPDRPASFDTHYSQPDGTLHMFPGNPDSLVGHRLPASSSDHQPAAHARHLMVPDYAGWQAGNEQYSSSISSLLSFGDQPFTRLSPSSTFMQGHPPFSTAFPSYVPSCYPIIRLHSEGYFSTRPPQHVQPKPSFLPFEGYDLSLSKTQNAFPGDSAFDGGQAGLSAPLQGISDQTRRRNHVAVPAEYATALALHNGSGMMDSGSSLTNGQAGLARFYQPQVEEDTRRFSGYSVSTLSTHAIVSSHDQYTGKSSSAILDESSQNTGAFREFSSPATASIESSIVDPPTREETPQSRAVKVLKNSRNLHLGFNCKKCKTSKWYDPADQKCLAKVHSIYYGAAVDVVAENLEKVLGWPKGTWNGARSSKMESFHVWMYINQDRSLPHKDLPGNADVNREAHKRRLADRDRRLRRRGLAESKNSAGESLNKSSLAPTMELTASETASATTRETWSSDQIHAFREKLIEWMRTVPRVHMQSGHNCISCSEKLWYRPGNCEDQSHSVYNSATVVVVGEYLEENGCKEVAVEDCHIWQYLKNEACPPTKLSKVRRSHQMALAQRRYDRRKALEAREARETKKNGKGSSHSSQ